MSTPGHRLGSVVEGGYQYREVDVVRQTVEQIMAERGVTQSRAYRIRREQAMKEFASVPINNSLKEAILISLFDGGRTDAKNLAVRTQRRGFAEAAHGVVHVIWALQKEGLVAFRESKKEGLQNVHLTQPGVTAARALHAASMPVPASATPLPAPAASAASASAPAASASAPAASVQPDPSPVTEMAESLGIPPEVPQPDKSFTRLGPAILKSRYPLIWKLVHRKERIEQAAATLEEEGLIEEAARALEAAVYSDLEREVVDLVKELDL